MRLVIVQASATAAGGYAQWMPYQINTAGFTGHDIASAAAQGFRDGQAAAPKR